MLRTVIRALFWPRAPRALIVLFAVLGGMLGAVAVAPYVLGYFLQPWSHSYGGRPALVGYWQGRIAFPQGNPRNVMLHLALPEVNRSSSRFDMVGAAKLCGSGRPTHYKVQGTTRNRQGTRFTLGFDPDHVPPGTHLDVIEGTWDGADHLDLRTTFYTIGPDGVARGRAFVERDARPDNPPGSIRFELRRAAEAAFNAAC